ncbi:TetR/AcrR family transcriptional regulator [Chromobacterium haemolyticum]|nr:TetR/AcrR family transcriptional regulator [Chromobacterium haemolyticum]
MTQSSDPKTDTRKRILDIAEQLLLSRGFNAFSYQHISSELGVRNAAIHYHFPKKSDLGVALIQRYRRRFQRFIDQQQAELDPRAQLEAYFGLSDSYYLQHRQICPSGILSTEFLTRRKTCSKRRRPSSTRCGYGRWTSPGGGRPAVRCVTPARRKQLA